MRGLFVGALLVAAVLLTASCATISKEACLAGDWQSIGYGDGLDGETLGIFDTYTKPCAKVGVTPQYEPYLEGRREGLLIYCTEVNGFRIGRDGGFYSRVCPAEVESAFLSGYADGKRLHAATTRLSDAQRSLAAAERSVKDLEFEARTTEDKSNSSHLTDEERWALRESIPDLHRKRREAIEEGRRASEAIREAEREVDDVKHMLSPRWIGYF